MIPSVSYEALIRTVPEIIGSANWINFTQCKCPIIIHSIGLSCKIFLTTITGCVHFASASVRYFFEGNLPNIGSDRSKLLIRGNGTAGRSMRNLHHGFRVRDHASSFNGR
ncbi:hypothetical protein ACB098_12G135000 [Castanea mollissima]